MKNNILSESLNWGDFKNRLSQLPEKAKGDQFEILTKHFLQINPTYATKLKHVWLLKDVPSKIRSFLNLPGPDEGIDLIAETKDKEYWAIQCKYREDENRSLSRKDIDTFTGLALVICKNISLGLVCTTADRFSYRLKKYGERLSFCAGDVWRALDEDFFSSLRQIIEGKVVTLKPFQPFPHQERAILNAHCHFLDDNQSRGKLISACGTGKSLTSYWIAGDLDAKTILIAVPSLALIRQSLIVWTREALAQRKEINWICVCSDESVGDIERDDMVMFTQDLGIRIHTDSNEIAHWLKDRKKGTTVVFTTYQSGRAIAEASQKAKTTFDLGILDEAHKTVGRRNTLFSHLLDDENLRINKRLFMTATERRYQGQSDEILSMDDPVIYGDTFELLSFKEALESDPPLLCDYKIITILVTRLEIAQLVRKNLLVRPDKGKWDKDVEAEMLASVIALRKAIQSQPIRHAISFHSSIARARAFKEIQEVFNRFFPEYKKLEAFHVSGKMPTAQRSRLIDDFEQSNQALITNARCLSEGIDIPDIDCILFADPRKSTIEIVQAVGRALRKSESKKLGYVIIPVIQDGDQPDADSLKSESYDHLLMTLRALASNDDRIVEYFRAISQGRRPGRGEYPIEIDIPIGQKIDTNLFSKSIELKLWSKLAKLSWRPFEDARNFANNLGIKSISEWKQYCKGELPEKGKLPYDMPTNPNRTYQDKGWINWGDWLSTTNIATQLRKYRSFEEARTFVHHLKLTGQSEWNKYCTGKLPGKGNKPEDIPANPHSTYKDDGWKNYGDWLGTGTIAPRLRVYLSFEEARTFVHHLKLTGQKDWKKYCKGELEKKGSLPDNIPANPNRTYKYKGWKGYGDWVGTGALSNKDKEYRSFEEARAFVRLLGLKNSNEWDQYCKGKLPKKRNLPEDIPKRPAWVYRDNGWINMGDWLGTGFIHKRFKKFRSFEEARTFVHHLNLKNRLEWLKYCNGELLGKSKLPDDIPTNPNRTYKDNGWIHLGDWLGTENIASKLRKYRTFEDARNYVRQLQLENLSEWKNYCRGKLPGKRECPNDIPRKPDWVYRDKGWKNYGDWLGTKSGAPRLRNYRPFKEARAFVHLQNLKNAIEWRKYCQGQLPGQPHRPNDIPANPDRTYKDNGWNGWGDWLGTGTVAPYLREYRPFKEARAFVHLQNLKNAIEWRKYCQGQLPGQPHRPNDIPANPDRTYKDNGWNGWGDWLGTGTVAPYLREYRPFKEARAWVNNLNLKSETEWRKYCKGQLPGKPPLPKDIPANPNQTYKYIGWKGVGDWLGTGTIATKLKEYLPFEEARVYVRQLGLTSISEWKKYCKGELPKKGKLPDNISTNPNRTYKDKGWTNWGDWLGERR